MYIDTEEGLIELAEKLRACEMLAIDTEFIREKTYFHRLGLIQVAGNGICAAVDPIAIKNIDPFLDLVKDPRILKVFHAGKQDLEILYRLCKEPIGPVFDTQVAATMVGWGAQISFAKIVHKVTGKRIHKTETYTDWCRRPLSKSQIEYALDDARYLVPVYEKLLKQLKKMDRLEWMEGELRDLSDPEKFKLPDPREQYARIKNIRGLKPGNLAVLRELAAWREEEAMRRDCLAKSIVRDEPLLEIARQLPRDARTLTTFRGFNSKEAALSGEKILKAIQAGLAVPEDQIPVLPETEGYSTSPGVEGLLAAYVQIRSEELKIEPNMLADRRLIHEFVKHCELKQDLDGLPLFQGWRRKLIGEALYSILEGKVGLAVDKAGKVILVPSRD
ncbi:MAG: ribonuclease D [Nitrospinae bacterium]|nr:ribonuclease D [Nitrospinota bacterium]